MTRDVKFEPETNSAPSSKQSCGAKKHTKRKSRKAYEWSNDLEHHVRGETALWVAVITQAMMDALSQAKNSEAQYHKHEAINWLTTNSKNFITVCHYAGMDPDYVRLKAKRCIAAPSLWRAEPGKGKRYLERKEYRQRQRDLKKARLKAAPALPPERIIIGPWA